jgi:hypothetical protein
VRWWLQVFEEGGDGRGGAAKGQRGGGGCTREMGEGGGCKSKRDLGEGRLGLGGTSGPDRVSRPNSFTRQLPALAHESNQNSTDLLVNASQKFQTLKAHHPK